MPAFEAPGAMRALCEIYVKHQPAVRLYVAVANKVQTLE
jgi:hypothetical protein